MELSGLKNSIIVPMAKISPVKRNLVVSRLRDGPMLHLKLLYLLLRNNVLVLIVTSLCQTASFQRLNSIKA